MSANTPHGQPPQPPPRRSAFVRPPTEPLPKPPAPPPAPPPPAVNPAVAPSGSSKADLPADDTVWYGEFREIIRTQIGFVLPAEPAPALRAFVGMRLKFLETESIRKYLSRLRTAAFGDPELTAITNAITIKKTHFFRDRVQFEGFREHMRKLVARRGEVRIWCAGCSTGEEPYSVAMIANAEGVPLDLKASDVNTDALATARRAQYTKLTIGEISEEFKGRYLLPLDRGFAVDSKVRRVPAFVHHNLMSDQYLKPMVGLWDVIFCRNVLIYFDRATVEDVVAKFHRVLAPDGRLILGAGESLHGKAADFELVNLGRSFAYRPLVVGRKTSSSVDNPIPLELIGVAGANFPGMGGGDDDGEDSDDIAHLNLPRFGPEDLPPALPRSSASGTPVAPFSLDEFEAEFHAGGMRRQTAIDRLREALRHRPDLAGLLTLGNALMQTGDLQGAIDAFSDAQLLHPLSLEAHFLIGVVQKKAGARWPAIQAFRRVLFLDPNFWPASFHLAGMYQAENMPAEARREYANTLRTITSGTAPAMPAFVSRLADEVLHVRFRDEVVAVCRAKVGP